MPDMGRLDGRRALVTGGGRGIGAAVARAPRDEGATVTVAARTATEIEAVAAAVDGHAVVMDVSDPASVEQGMDEVGDIDVLVANAGGVWRLRGFGRDGVTRGS